MIDRIIIEDLDFQYKDSLGESHARRIRINRSSLPKYTTVAIGWGSEAYNILRKYRFNGSKLKYKTNISSNTFSNERQLRKEFPSHFALFCELVISRSRGEVSHLQLHLHNDATMPGARINFLRTTQRWCRPEQISYHIENQLNVPIDSKKKLERSLDGNIVGLFMYIKKPFTFDSVTEILSSYYEEKCGDDIDGRNCIVVQGDKNAQDWCDHTGTTEINKKSLASYWSKRNSNFSRAPSEKKIGFMCKHDRSPSAGPQSKRRAKIMSLSD